MYVNRLNKMFICILKRYYKLKRKYRLRLSCANFYKFEK